MKKLVFIVAAIALGVSNANTQEMSKAEVFDLLVMWQGKWKNTATFEKSKWTPKSFTIHGHRGCSSVHRSRKCFKFY